jgi:hypothetical protein
MTYLGLQMLQNENASRHLEVLLIFQQVGRRAEGQNNCSLGSLAAIFYQWSVLQFSLLVTWVIELKEARPKMHEYVYICSLCSNIQQG